MLGQTLIQKLAWGVSCGAILVTLSTSASQAQIQPVDGRRYCPPPPCETPGTIPQYQTPSQTPPTQQTPQIPAEPSFQSERGAALGTQTVALGPGYIDNAAPMSQFRLRFDAAFDNNRPDRAEFFYAKCGCFGTKDAKGPPLTERSVDYQDISGYLELATSERFSIFAELPVRFLNPEVNANTNGIADINAGFKYALLACEDKYLTFQLRTYVPTGDAGRGLGTAHASLEPAVLYSQQVTERLNIFSEVRDWIPLGGSDFAGNVVRYGIGAGFDVYHSCCWRVAPIAEFVGWTVLDGKELDGLAGATKDAGGDTIVNAKLGVRMNYGEAQSLYLGYGRALTGEVWYKDIIRLEYRVTF